MCGIFGIIRKGQTYASVPSSSNNNVLVPGIFKSLALQSEARGRDSTGVILLDNPTGSYQPINGIKVPKKERYTVFKDKIPANRFVESAGFKTVMSRFNDTSIGLIGHTRAGSSSSPHNNANNHPHVCGNVIGVHNGNIHNWKQLVAEYNLPMAGRCDSEVIFRLIDKFITEDNLTFTAATQLAATKLKGSFACAAVSVRDKGHIYLFKKSAPIKILHRTIGNFVMFASETTYIHNAFRESRIEKKHSPCYTELCEYVLPDNHGIDLDTTKTTYSEWIQEVEPFNLDG